VQKSAPFPILKIQIMNFSSICAKELGENRTTTPHILPLYATSSFAFESIDQGIEIFKNIESGHTYSRYANPTVDTVAKKIGLLESHGLGFEADCIMTSSGMSAISTLLIGLLKQGDSVLTQGNLYGGTTELLKGIFEPLGIRAIFCDLSDLQAVEQQLASDKSIKMLYGETPANPTLACIDLAAIGALGQKYQVLTAIDNTFLTPYLQQPLKYGIDFVVHSTTKFLNGHGNSIAGAIVARDRDLLRKKVWRAMKLTGTNCSPFEAWLTHQGMKTLTLRMDRHSTNALALAQWLELQPQVLRVNYTGLPSHKDHQLALRQMSQHGAMLSFELHGGIEAGIKFMNRVKFCTLAPTLGDTDTLILHPASMSHLHVPREVREANGITDGLIRISVGIEDVRDIMADLEQAFGG
jgi:methionine-gamma-lyase